MLKRAVIDGDLEGVQKMLARGVDVNEVDEGGRTPLLWAARIGYGQLDIVKELLAAGADVNIASKNDVLPLMEAAGDGHLDIVQVLLANGAGATINQQSYRGGHTALMYAAMAGYLDVVEVLIEVGADVNIKADDGKTALDYAKEQYPEIVRAIEQAIQNKQYSITHATQTTNSTVNVQQGKKEYTKEAAIDLLEAVRCNDLETVQKMLAEGADIDMQDDRENTALMFATFQRNLDMVKELITRGINVNAKEQGGNTAFMFVAMNGDVDIAKALLAGGALINTQNNTGKTAFDYARMYGHAEIEQLIQEQQQKVDFERIIKGYEKEKMTVPIMMKRHQYVR